MAAGAAQGVADELDGQEHAAHGQKDHHDQLHGKGREGIGIAVDEGFNLFQAERGVGAALDGAAGDEVVGDGLAAVGGVIGHGAHDLALRDGRHKAALVLDEHGLAQVARHGFHLILGGHDVGGQRSALRLNAQFQPAVAGIIQREAGGFHGDGVFQIQLLRRHAHELGKTVFHQLFGVRPASVFAGVEHHGDELDAVLFGRTHKVVTGAGMEAGFDAVGVLVEILVFLQTGVEEAAGGVREHTRAVQVAFGQVIGVGFGDIAEGFVLHGGLRQLGHIAHGGIMVVVVQTVGVHEVRGGAAVHGGSLVHHLHKGVHRSAHGFGDEVCALVGGAHEGAVEQILEIDAFAHVQVHHGVAVLNAPHGGIAEIHGLAHVAHHDAQQNGHDLGGGSGVHDRIGVLFKNDVAGLGLDEDGGLGIQLILVQVFGMLGIVGISIAGQAGRDVAHLFLGQRRYGRRERACKQHSQHKAQAAQKPMSACKHGISSRRNGWVCDGLSVKKRIKAHHNSLLYHQWHEMHKRSGWFYTPRALLSRFS